MDVAERSPVPSRHRHPLHPNVRRSPYFPETERAGALEYMVYNHMYMPVDYGRDPLEEYLALTERVTLWDVGAERQTELRGPDAVRLADFLCARDLSGLAVDRCRYTMVCDDDGLIMAECIALRPHDDVVWLSHGDVDLTLWARAIASQGTYDVAVSEPDVAPLQVQGPLAARVLAALGAPVGGLGAYACASAVLSGTDVVVSRTGWSGGDGFELYPVGSERALDLWGSVLVAGSEHGILVTGPNLVRACERAITDTHYFVNSRMDPFEAGAGWAVDLDAGPFVGREALVRAASRPPARSTVGLIADEDVPMPRLEWFWPVFDGREVGEVRWAVRSIALGRPIAIALVDSSVRLGDAVRVRHPAGELVATVVELPFVKDPASG